MSQISLTSTFLTMATSGSTSVGGSNASVNNSSDTFSQELSRAKDANRKDSCKSNKKEYSELVSRSESKKDVNQYQAKNNAVKNQKEVSNQLEDELEEVKSKDNIIDEQILALMSQTLQMPIEEILAQLESMGLTTQDLLTTEGFGQFINQVMADGDINALLSGDLDIKQMSQLFDELNQLGETLNLESNDAQLGQQNLEMDMQTNPSLGEQQAAIHEEVALENVAEQAAMEQASESRYNTEEEAQLSFVTEGGAVDSELGITVPIHNFTTTTFTQTFQNDAGQVTQMITTKQTVNGKAFIEQIDFKVLAQTKEINVSLSPKELGQMNVKVMEQNGVMVAEIKVENEKAKEFILNEIEQLKESLEAQGLNVADVKVDIRQENHQTQQMEQERQKSSKRIQEIISKHLEEETIEEVTESPLLSDSEVDYIV